MSRPTHGAGASAAALAMCAMDPDDTEGAEPQPVDAEEKNMAGDGKKRRVERTHDPSRHTHDTEGAELPPVDAEEKNMAGGGKKRRVERTHDASRHTRGVRGAGASAAALVMRAVDTDDTDREGAEPAAHTQGETDGNTTYVAPSRPHPPHIHTYLLPPTRQSPLPSSASTCRHSSVAIVRGRASSSSPTPTVRAPPLSRHPHRPRTAVPFPYAPRPHTLYLKLGWGHVDEVSIRTPT